jgi:RNA polymerase subunit RPABC4/transcription elongation factor Spt4
MQVKSETRTGLTAEIKIVPAWVWTLAGVALVSAQVFFNIVMARQPHTPPAWGRALMGLAAGIGAGCYLLFLGYVSRDAKRRGMNPILWTFVAILIPNGLGFILYFILRQPRRGACPQCENAVQTGFNFCPRCNYKLNPSCQQCQRVVAVNDVYCSYCGASLQTPVSNSSTKLPRGGV